MDADALNQKYFVVTSITRPVVFSQLRTVELLVNVWVPASVPLLSVAKVNEEGKVMFT